MTDIILNKVATIQKCHQRILDVYDNDPANLTDFTKQDSIILNIQRACQACIDLAMHISSSNKFGIPQNSRDAFDLLADNNIIPQDLCNNLRAMVGFRNIAVHDYQTINIKIIQNIIKFHLDDLAHFTLLIIKIQS